MNFNINLRAWPLEIVENFVSQKCLIPKSLFPKDITPGTWAKCFLTSFSYTVCQIYPRNDIKKNCCYLDKSVRLGEFPNDDLILRKIEIIEKYPKCIKEINAVIILDEEIFRADIKQLNLKFLEKTTLNLLQMFQITKLCRLDNLAIKKLGISAICVSLPGIDANGDLEYDNYCFTIDDLTIVKIIDVQMAQSKFQRFHNHGFEESYQSLCDILQMQSMQKMYQRLIMHSLNTIIIGHSGSGKTTLLNVFIRENLCNCFYISAISVLGQYPGDTEFELRRIFKAATTFVKNFKPRYATIILIEDIHILCPSLKETSKQLGNNMRVCTQLISLLDDLFTSGLEILCLATASQPDQLNELIRRPGRFENEISLPIPNVLVRSQLCKALFRDVQLFQQMREPLNAELYEWIATRTHGYVVGDLVSLINKIALIYQRDQRGDIKLIIKKALKRTAPSSLRVTDVSFYRIKYGFETIGGMHNLKNILRLSVLAGIGYRYAYTRFGIMLPRGVLLYGPPGCAKTTIAKCIAAEGNMTFIATSSAEVYSPFVGCAEKFIKKLFNMARRHTPCLIFLDEIDTLVGRRTLVSDSQNDLQSRLLATLLTELDGINSCCTGNAENYVLVVAATNRPDMLDDAIIRPGRFDKIIFVPPPDFESRYDILEMHRKRMPFAKDVDMRKIATQTENFSGADLCNLCNEAAIHAFQNNFDATEISSKDFDATFLTMGPSLTSEQMEWYSQFENRL